MAGLKVGVIGLGHVGLPTALGLAELGWEVVGSDHDQKKAALIAQGSVPFYEPEVESYLRKHLATGRFSVASDVPTNVREAEILFVCVGTPQRDDGSADLSQIEGLARTIAQHLNGYKLIVEKSTTPVRTAEQIKLTISRYGKGDHHFDVAVNPEFLREGTALRDFFDPQRIIIGVETERARALLLQLYQPLFEASVPGLGGLPSDRIVVTSLSAAELIKHAANAFLATKISFINMVGDLCEAAGADVTEVARALGFDPRIGPAFLQAGVGFGGYCLPKDVRALIRIGEEQGVDVGLLRSVVHINEQRVDHIVGKIKRALWVLQGKTVALLGLAFKPMTDDVRGAPSLRVITSLLAEGAHVRLHDPQAMANARAALLEDARHIVYCASPYEAAESAHVLVILTEWEEYRSLDLGRLKGLLQLPIVVDGRNMIDPSAARQHGFEYYGMGR
jgi:UDPglucose 6-dehydrogenase